MFAIVTISGKQYRVKEGDQIKIANLGNQVGDKIEFDKILLLENSKKLTVGEPYVNDITVSATVLKHGRDRKVIIFKKKRRKGYRRKNGHRQSFSLVQIDSISESKKKAAPKKKIAAKKKTVPKKKTAPKESNKTKED